MESHSCRKLQPVKTKIHRVHVPRVFWGGRWIYLHSRDKHKCTNNATDLIFYCIQANIPKNNNVAVRCESLPLRIQLADCVDALCVCVLSGYSHTVCQYGWSIKKSIKHTQMHVVHYIIWLWQVLDSAWTKPTPSQLIFFASTILSFFHSSSWPWRNGSLKRSLKRNRLIKWRDWNRKPKALHFVVSMFPIKNAIITNILKNIHKCC